MDELGGVGEIGAIGHFAEAPDIGAGEVIGAADGVGSVESAANRVIGEDRFETSDKDARLIIDGQPYTPRDGLKDGDWLHDPRQLTPDKADDLKKLLDDPKLRDSTKDDIREFLDDYQNKRDRLFPDDPSPLPRPYPFTDPAPDMG